MKTTVDIRDDLLTQAKLTAVARHQSLKSVIESCLLAELKPKPRAARERRRSGAIRWVTAPGGLPKGLHAADRASMSDWIRSVR